MKFRSKLFLAIMLVVVVTTGISVGFMGWHFERVLRDQIGSQILTMTATTAAFLDGDLHKQVKGPGDETSAAYLTLRDQMRKARDVNRRDDFHVKYAYTLTVSPQDPTAIRFGVDAEEDTSVVTAVGEPYRTKLSNPFDVEKMQYDKVFTTDDWGTFLTANAPIRDGQGQVVAALGVDVEATEVTEKVAQMFRVALLGAGFALLLAFSAAWFVAQKFSRPMDDLRQTVAAISQGDLKARSRVDSNDEFGVIGTGINAMAVGLEERSRLQTSFERYVPSKVVASIMKSSDGPALQGERRQVTVLFSDLRSFSKATESRRPEDVVAFLNSHFEAMCEVIERHGGTLDKFIGDGMMALFGAPNDDPHQEEHAILAALEMQERIRALGQQPGAGGSWPVMQMGIGINSGYAVVGNLGSNRHMEYTAIGETINSAAYLEAKTKEYGVDIIISQYTYNAVRGLFKTKPLGPIAMKGYTEQMTVYSIEGRHDQAPAAET
jgi:adenylate cyclase